LNGNGHASASVIQVLAIGHATEWSSSTPVTSGFAGKIKK
jgi:hypothetical protein